MVFVIVFVFVIVLLLVRSCQLIITNKCLLLRVTSLQHRSLKVFPKCLEMYPHCLCHCLFVDQLMFFHHSNKKSRVSKIAP